MNMVNGFKINMTVEAELLHRELTKDIIDSAYNVHNALGCGLLEKVYGNALFWDIELKKMRVVPQKEFKVLYRDREVGIYSADLIIEDKILVEVKSVYKLDNVQRTASQLLENIGYSCRVIAQFYQAEIRV